VPWAPWGQRPGGWPWPRQSPAVARTWDRRHDARAATQLPPRRGQQRGGEPPEGKPSEDPPSGEPQTTLAPRLRHQEKDILYYVIITYIYICHVICIYLGVLLILVALWQLQMFRQSHGIT